MFDDFEETIRRNSWMYMLCLKPDQREYIASHWLVDYYRYYPDCGHSILAIPKCLLEEAMNSGTPADYFTPFPVAYVVEKGFERHNGYLVCEGEYDDTFGLLVPDEYSEYV